MQAVRWLLLLSVFLAAFHIANGTNFAVLLQGNGRKEDDLCGNDEDFFKGKQIEAQISETKSDYDREKLGARRVEDRYREQQMDANELALIGDGTVTGTYPWHGGAWSGSGTTYTRDGGGGGGAVWVDTSIMQPTGAYAWSSGDWTVAGSAECRDNWEVNACNKNCSIRIPLVNEDGNDVDITDVKLRCARRRRCARNRDGSPALDPDDDCDGVLSFSGGSAFSAEVIECPEGVSLTRSVVVAGSTTWSGGDIAAGRRSWVGSGGVLEISAEVAEDVRVLVSIESTDTTANTNATSHVVVDLLNVDLVTILNKPLLCCLKSVRQRAALGKIMADVLTAYEKGDASKALELLKLFISFATAAECAVDDGEKTCLQEAIAAAIAGGRLVAEEFGQEGLEESAESGDFLRRSGEAEAAAMAYRKSVGGGRSTMLQGGSEYSYNWALARNPPRFKAGSELSDKVN